MTDKTIPLSQNIFSGSRELARLATQIHLMRGCEAPVFHDLFEGRHGLDVLDVGCNNGEKSLLWFSDPAVGRVLGLEYDELLVRQARKACHDERFRFCPFDAEAPELTQRLARLMEQEQFDGFDIIYLSFVLSHLDSPETLLSALRPVLRPGGCLVAVETNDALSTMAPDTGRLRVFLDILSQDPYAGDRSTGGRLLDLLAGCGFRDPVLRCSSIDAGPGEVEKKAMIFEMFFSYLPEDTARLRKEAPEDERYIRWEQWIREHHAPLHRTICAPETRISMGLAVVTGLAGTERE